MFRRPLAVILLAMGSVWIVQGFSIAETGSFMDGAPLWGWLGLGLVMAALLLLFYRRPTE